MDDRTWLTDRFEEDRSRLRAVAYRMLGSTSEADDAVQETWLRLRRADAGDIENVGGWLTTVVARVCLNMLRARSPRREEPLTPYVPDPIVSFESASDPEQSALMADSVGLALLVVLETLGPAERLAFVLHDMFAVPFDEIAPMLDRSPEATRQLASRARRRVRGTAPIPDPDLARQREVVDAFFAAARAGDFDALVAVLAPDVVVRSDGGSARPEATAIVRGAPAVARRATAFADPAAGVRPALVNDAAGAVVTAGGRPVAVWAFTVANGRIAEIDMLSDPDRIARLDLSPLAHPDRPNRPDTSAQ
jgi:RNA polymerase sigma factor (sigma-70 family)